MMMATGHSQGTETATGVRSGDIPSTSSGLDDVIIKVSKAISDDADLRKLGRELGVDDSDIDRAIETNWHSGVKTSYGNLTLLRDWAKNIRSSQLFPTLRGALKKAGLVKIEETCFPSSPPGEHNVMPDDMSKLRNKLKSRYCKVYSKVNTSPVDPGSRIWLQHIFVSLILMVGLAWDQKKEIDYNRLFELIKTETEEGFVTRLAFTGEAGVGKSTLFAKIALDWAEGKILQEIDLLFLESFREIGESQNFGDIVMNHFPDNMDIKGERIDTYVSQNQTKVLILLDGLDEAKIDIKKSNRNNSVVSIVRGEKFIDTTVLISSRPHGVDQIKSVTKIHEKYKFIQVKGFTRENMSKYIEQFFGEDKDSASSLLQFVDSNQVIDELMAPIPIFCCMLCYMWKEPSRRDNLMKMRTLPQLLKRLVFSLQEQYCSKNGDDEHGYEAHTKKVTESLKEVGRVAFKGLLANQLIFDEETVGSEEGIIACEVGILSKEKRLAPMEIRESQGKQFIVEFSFPHKLLQEYASTLYLASLFDDDRSTFDRILTDHILKDKEFTYVLYFTAALGGMVGRSVMEALCKKVDDIEFIIDVAYECNDDGSTIDSVRDLLKTKTTLDVSSYIYNLDKWFFTLKTLGKEMRNRLSGDGNLSATKVSSSYLAAVGLFTLQNLRSLLIYYKRDDADFYKGICEAASQSKIEELKHVHDLISEEVRLGPAASSYYARAICSMPNLRSLELNNVGLSDEYYSIMAAEASTSMIEVLKHECEVVKEIRLGPAASSHYARAICSMPNLRSLELNKVDIEVLRHECEIVEQSPAAFSHYARAICSMPNLRSLELNCVDLSDEDYSTMAAEASTLKIQTLSIANTEVTRHRLHAILSLLCLQSLSLTRLSIDEHDESMPIPQSSLVELTVDAKDVARLWKLGLHTSCSLVKKLSLRYYCHRRNREYLWSIDGMRREERIVDGHIVSMLCSPFTHLIELHIIDSGELLRLDPTSFCNSVKTSCPRLVKLFIQGVKLGNNQATEIIQSMKTHPQLTCLLIEWCATNEDLDPLIAQMNSEGKLTVSVKHGSSMLAVTP